MVRFALSQIYKSVASRLIFSEKLFLEWLLGQLSGVFTYLISLVQCGHSIDDSIHDFNGLLRVCDV